MNPSPDTQERIRRNSAMFSATSLPAATKVPKQPTVEDDIDAIAAAAAASTVNLNSTTPDLTPKRRTTAPPSSTSIRRLRGRILKHKSTIQRANHKQKQKNVERMSQYVASGNSDDIERLENTSLRIADWLSKQHQAYYRSSNRGDVGPATFRKSFICSPHSRFVQSWKSAMIALTLISVWWELFDWAFEPIHDPMITALRIVTEILFVLDIIMHFRITFPDKSTLQLVTNQKDVARRYFHTSFPLDLLGTVPVIVAVLVGNLPSTRTVKLLRLARLARIWNAEQMKLDYVQLLKLLIYFATLAHFMACVWYGLCGAYHLNDYPGDRNMLGREFGVFITSPIAEKYTYSMYFGLLLVLGENIPPSTVVEAWFAWFALFLGCIAFSAVVGQVTVLLQELHHERNRYYERLLALEAKMHILKIPAELRTRVIEWEEYTWQRFHAQDANALFADENPSIPMPRSLRTELALHAHAPMLLTCPLFYGAEEGFIAEVAMLLRLRISSAGDLIIQRDERDESMMFLKAGEAFILSPSDESQIIVHLKAGSFFGELSVCFGGKRSASIRAATYCELVVLSKSHLEEAWSVYPKAREHILNTAHRRKAAIKKMNSENAAKKNDHIVEKEDV